ncbi:hypothetical protein HK101_005521 [Irineochytrium annulatum]|nr:hypothetical protein HK101_005521 [Irineochytrium annulatum]
MATDSTPTSPAPASSKRKPFLIALDFDWTVIDEDSDHWVFDQLSAELRAKMKTLSGKVQWTDLMVISQCLPHALTTSQHQLLGELHAVGTSREDIVAALSRVPLRPAMAELFRMAREAGGDVIIVSDANTVYIDEILRYNGLRECVAEIVTNPGTWDAAGRLNGSLSPHYGKFTRAQSSFSLFSKGAEMSQRMDSYERIFYGGDGRNDFCPMTKLADTDVALPRRGHSLEKYLNHDKENLAAIRASIHWWSTADELLEIVRSLIEKK